LSAALVFNKIPIIPVVNKYLEQKAIPGGTQRNWKSYGHTIGDLSEHQRLILADPQTSGGLLIAVDSNHTAELEQVLQQAGVPVHEIGSFHPRKEKNIMVV
jgi:selenide,water dikinase